MTLVEILIALAIASLMTLTGWRAVDALQTSRDRVQADAAHWQQLDDLFVTLEADLRRASLTDFSAGDNSINMLQPAVDGSPDVAMVRYRIVPPAPGNGAGNVASARLLRETPTGTTPMLDAHTISFAYSPDGNRFDSSTSEYPRALRVVVVTGDSRVTVERLMALR